VIGRLREEQQKLIYISVNKPGMTSKRIGTFNQKGFTRNFLALMKSVEVQVDCCSTSLFDLFSNNFDQVPVGVYNIEKTSLTNYQLREVDQINNITPSGTADPQGNPGDFAWDNNFIYVKTNVGWKRSALSTF
jgi:hypothetical protein